MKRNRNSGEIKRKSDKEWFRRYQFVQKVGNNDYDDRDEPKLSHKCVLNNFASRPPEYDKHSFVLVRRYDKDGNLLEEKVEEHFY